MKKALPYILITVIVLASLVFVYMKASNNSDSPLLSADSGKPEVADTIDSSTGIPFKNYGPAPEFKGINSWLNSEPLKMSELKGKVVLVDFWTYSCINCIRTFPYLKEWHEKYKDQGLVIVGVHTPEFAFEKDKDNLTTAISRYGLEYPIAQDNNYSTWNAYSNKFWPANYLIDKDGKIVYEHFGEGKYDVTENAIRQLIGLPGGVEAGKGPDINASKVKSKEIYFGSSRLELFSSKEDPSTQAQVYTFPDTLKSNNFALEGTWKLVPESAVLTQGAGRIRLNFNAGKVFMVAASIKPTTVKIFVDGKEVNQVTIQQSQLYTLFDTQDYKQHILEIEIPEPGLEAFTFTFG